MLRSLTTLAAAAVLGGGTAAAAPAISTNHKPSLPPRPVLDLSQLHDLRITPPTVIAPNPPRPTLRPVECRPWACSRNDPTALAGSVVSFNGATLTERTDSGAIHAALVGTTTTVACPPLQAVDDGRPFNPVRPSPPKLGEPPAPTPQITDRYACSPSNLTTARRIAGAELGRDAHGQLRWIAIALAPR